MSLAQRYPKSIKVQQSQLSHRVFTNNEASSARHMGNRARCGAQGPHRILTMDMTWTPSPGLTVLAVKRVT